MATESISSTKPASSTLENLNQQSRTPVTTLDQDDFLKLLVTQMTTQDPMKPMEDLSSFSQLASFSALEQSKATQASMAVIQANSMLGHFVEVADDFGKSMVGQVSQVLMIEGEPQLVVDGERFKLSQVTSIATMPFGADPGGGTGTTTPPNNTTPTPSTDPRLGTAPRLGADPVLGVAPGGSGDAVAGPAPLAVLAELLNGAPRMN
jgi:flagellar basal-body rod modification protein FlgD